MPMSEKEKRFILIRSSGLNTINIFKSKKTLSKSFLNQLKFIIYESKFLKFGFHNSTIPRVVDILENTYL